MGILIKPQLPPELYVPTSLSWELSRHSCLGELSHGGMGTSARCWVCFLGKPSSGRFRPLLLGEEVSNSTWRSSGPWGLYPPRAGTGWRAAGD